MSTFFNKAIHKGLKPGGAPGSSAFLPSLSSLSWFRKHPEPCQCTLELCLCYHAKCEGMNAPSVSALKSGGAGLLSPPTAGACGPHTTGEELGVIVTLFPPHMMAWPYSVILSFVYPMSLVYLQLKSNFSSGMVSFTRLRKLPSPVWSCLRPQLL